jgi:hypothetical protein
VSDNQKDQFEAAGAGKQAGLLTELFQLLKHNKKYWMLPLLLILLGFGVLIFLSSTAAAPFLYTFF